LFLLPFHDELSDVCTRAGKWLPKNLGFLGLLKNLKIPKFSFFNFLVKFYTDHIKFHILIVICEYCYVSQKTL